MVIKNVVILYIIPVCLWVIILCFTRLLQNQLCKDTPESMCKTSVTLPAVEYEAGHAPPRIQTYPLRLFVRTERPKPRPSLVMKVLSTIRVNLRVHSGSYVWIPPDLSHYIYARSLSLEDRYAARIFRDALMYPVPPMALAGALFRAL